ncbi:MAG: acetylornithine/succinyldiaminopimelate transaminase [Burkholderiales bacterium]|jgi:acetylornithine/N-succinyldiaminopimelate aminotransferase|nr:acetylornithine/succinyldiaminopimelate transaminase [Burkholderiales bacterium]
MAGEKITRDMFDQLMVPCYAPAPFIPVRGEGSRVWDQHNKMYIDFAAGVAVSALGHCHPALVEALTRQAKSLWHVSNWLTNEPALILAKQLTESTFADRVFFCNSGAEANEAALKLARRYAHNHGGHEKVEIISAVNAFHGRTLFTVSAGGQPKYSSGFGPKPANITHVPFNDTIALQECFERFGDKICAMILEPVQGESGIFPATEEFLHLARHLTSWHKAALIFDEVQTGVGRTGALYAYQSAGVTPDIMTTAKGLGGGIPIGAMLTTHEFASAFGAGVHGSTYGGNPLVCAVASQVMEIVNTPDFLKGVKARGEKLIAGLNRINERLSCFSEIRSAGLLIGCELDGAWRERVPDAIAAAGKEGLLVLAAGPQTLRLAPPLNIPDEDIAEGLARLEKALLKGFGKK